MFATNRKEPHDAGCTFLAGVQLTEYFGAAQDEASICTDIH
jgi:hypothetical protein